MIQISQYMHSQEQPLPPGAVPGFESYGFSHPHDWGLVLSAIFIGKSELAAIQCTQSQVCAPCLPPCPTQGWGHTKRSGAAAET